MAKATTRQSFVVTTGTGSGKSLCFFVPIIDAAIRARAAGESPRTRAIVIYPMNALANSQMKELEKFIEQSGLASHLRPTFARYTGQEDEDERKLVSESKPDILLTNFMMLELLMTRQNERDRTVISNAEGLDFLVLDELHTYRPGRRRGHAGPARARSTKHLLLALEEFRSLGIQFISYQENLDTTSPLGQALFTIIAAVAQLERDLIRERVSAGIRNARANGKRLGRPRREVNRAARRHCPLRNCSPLAAPTETQFPLAGVGGFGASVFGLSNANFKVNLPTPDTQHRAKGQDDAAR